MFDPNNPNIDQGDAKIRADGYVEDHHGEGHHVVTHIASATAVFNNQDDPDDRFVYYKLTCYFSDGTPAINMLFNAPLVSGLITDMGRMLKVLFGVEDAPPVPDIPPDWDSMGPAATDPYLDVPAPTDNDYNYDDDRGPGDNGVDYDRDDPWGDE